MAIVNWREKNRTALPPTMSRNDRTRTIPIWRRTRGNCLSNGVQTNGSTIAAPSSVRQNDRPIGGVVSCTPRATTMLHPQQNIAAVSAA